MNKRKTVGGDIIRVLIQDPVQQAYSPGRVHDNQDGTYTAEVEALWSGRAEIIAYLVYTRQAVTAMYRLRTEVSCLFQFKNIHVVKTTAI